MLVLSAISPEKNTTRITYVKTLVNELSKKIHTQIIWVVCQPDSVITCENNDESIHNIQEYKNGLELIKLLKPDIILVNSGIEILQYSISLVAKNLQIPLVGFSASKIDVNQILLPGHYNFTKRFFSNSVPTDDISQKQFMRRGRFMFYKTLFSIRTKRTVHFSFYNILKDVINDFIVYIFNKPLPRNRLPDFHLIHQESQIPILEKLGLRKDQLVVIGSILMDNIHKKFLAKFKQTSNHTPLKILIITDSLYEHGIWTSQQRENFLKKIFSILKNTSNISFSLKIHPANESFEFYDTLMNNLGIKTDIFQSENLWDIISDFDMIISYGYSTAHTEIAYSGMKMILLNDSTNLPRFPLVKEAMESGNIQYCENLKDLIPAISSFLQIEIKPSKEFIAKRNDLFYKFDGKSAERGADAILSLIKKKERWKN